MNITTTTRTIAAAATLAAVAGAANAETTWALTDTQQLLKYDSESPMAIQTGVAVNGLDANETLRGIDFRPATGELYAVGSFSNLYTIDTMTGAATKVGDGFDDALDGSAFGFDFNPTIDRIRVVSETDQNLVLNPNDGTSTDVTDLFYESGDPNEGVDPNVVASAYTNSFPGATETQLFGIDSALDILVTQANSDGNLTTIGDLGVDINDRSAIDISGGTGIAYLAAENTGASGSTFWQIDLDTGEASLVGDIGGGAIVTSIAVVPAPGAAALAGVAGLAAIRRRRA